MKSITALGFAGMLGAVVLLLTGCGSGESPGYVVKGELALRYMIETSPNEASGCDDIRAGQYRNRELRFYPSCIVVLDGDGRNGWVAPMNRIRDFAWQKK